MSRCLVAPQVYWLMMAGDWLQGPYVYALYSSYGFSQEDIAVMMRNKKWFLLSTSPRDGLLRAAETAET